MNWANALVQGGTCLAVLCGLAIFFAGMNSALTFRRFIGLGIGLVVGVALAGVAG